MRTWRFPQLNKPVFDSRIKSDEIGNKERWIGFFMGPALVATVYAAVGGSYLNSFYTDVLHLNSLAAGLFLTLMPILSKILDAITNVIMGHIVDNTKSRQGKARPWILLSGPLMTISAILLFTVPTSSMTVTAIWVTCSYNLFFCVAYTMYNLSNVITLPLSTRDNKVRDTLAIAQSMGVNMVAGLILAVVFPSFILPYIGVNQSRWIMVMSVMALLAAVGTLLQYFFIKERVTEEIQTANEKASQGISIREQVKGCLSSKYWVMVMIVMFVYWLCNNISVNAMLYYANWVVGTYNDGHTLSLLNIIGQALLGPGVLLIWPLVKKLGKQKLYVTCGIIAIIGGMVGVIYAHSLPAALIALTIRSIGALPITYVTLSVLADALDHVEWQSGHRCDGFSSSVYSIIITVTAGLGLGLLNMGLSQTGYVAPAADGSWVAQSASVQNFCTLATFGVPAIGMLIITVIFIFFDLEKKLPAIHEEIRVRENPDAAEVSDAAGTTDAAEKADAAGTTDAAEKTDAAGTTDTAEKTDASEKEKS